MHSFTIDRLECDAVSTEAASHGGIDDLLLDVRIDDEPREPHSPHPVMRAGNTWNLSETFPFGNEIEFSLHQWPDFGKVSKRISGKESYIHGTDPQSGSIQLQEVGGPADYTVEYDVTPDAFANPPADTVDHAIAKFEDSIGGPWSRLDDDAVKTWIAHLAKRPIGNRSLPEEFDQQNGDVDDVFEVQQDSLGYCGNATIEFSMAYTQPRRFVEACRAVFETGAVVGQYHVLRTSLDLRRSPSPTREYEDSSWLAKICKKKYTIPEGDWMFMAHLEDTDDLWDWEDENGDDVPDPVPNSAIRGITFEDLQEGSYSVGRLFWIREVLGLSDGDKSQSSSTTGVDCLRHAADAVRNGGIAILDIDTQLITVDDPTDISSPFEHNHVVSLYEDSSGTVLDESGGTFTFKVHSWGKSYSIDSFPANRINQLLEGVQVGE